jgi:hypothetical protein
MIFETTTNESKQAENLMTEQNLDDEGSNIVMDTIDTGAEKSRKRKSFGLDDEEDEN